MLKVSKMLKVYCGYCLKDVQVHIHISDEFGVSTTSCLDCFDKIHKEVIEDEKKEIITSS